MSERGIQRMIVVACGLGLVALALMVWSVLVPTVWPVMVAMSLGQVFGTGSLGLYLVAVALDLRRARVLGRVSSPSPSPSPSPRPTTGEP